MSCASKATRCASRFTTGPVLGAWASDLRRVWLRVAGEDGEVKDVHREVVQKREDYDG
jgi:hypothetical protein